MKKIIIVGSGVNGLVAANYLVKAGYDVTIIEKKQITGCACIKDSEIIEVKQGPFAGNIDKSRFKFVSQNKLIIE